MDAENITRLNWIRLMTVTGGVGVFHALSASAGEIFLQHAGSSATIIPGNTFAARFRPL